VNLRLRAYLGIGVPLALLFASLITLQRYAASYSGQSVDTYGAAAAAERFRSVAAALPPGAALGYITDVPAHLPQRHTLWAVARYAVAPAVLHPEPKGDMLLGDVRRAGSLADLMRRERLRVHRDFGNGVYLFRRIPE
jgi:hypothetical protein